MSAFKGLDFGKSYSLWRNYVANLFLVTLVALTIKHESQITAVLYTLLGITIIGAILGGLQAIASPRISLAYLVGGNAGSWSMGSPQSVMRTCPISLEMICWWDFYQP
jgi:hypothetical protein